MIQTIWIGQNDPLPPASSALREPAGLVAASLELNIPRLHEAYSNGVFPWYGPGDPVLWWSPEPRGVLFGQELHLSRSLRKRMRQIETAQNATDLDTCVVTVNYAFKSVMQACARRSAAHERETWITPEMKSAYTQWHEQGHVHSVETWMNGQLAGGLYGVSLGGMFFGESMFTRQTDGSKIALVHLVRYLLKHDVNMIDCQFVTPHLKSLGAREITRARFMDHVKATRDNRSPNWNTGWLDTQGVLHEIPADFPIKPLTP